MGRTTSTPVFLALALLLLAPACGWKADGAARLAARFDRPDVAEDTAEDTTVPEVDLGDVGGAGLPGRWAVQILVKGGMSPLVVQTWPFVERTWFLAEVDADAAQAVLTFCGQQTDVDGTMDSETKIPDGLRDALAGVPLYVALDEHGVEAQPLPWLWGFVTAEIDDLSVKPVDVAAGDGRLLDQDEDGNPGVTMEVLAPFAGVRYMARWERWDLEAAALSPDGQRVEGGLAADLAEYPLGAAPTTLNAPSNLVADASGHGYHLRRVPVDYTCEELLAQAAGLFPEPAE